MKTDIHHINGKEIVLHIEKISATEAIDVENLPKGLYDSGGFRISAVIDGVPAGMRFYSGNLGSSYWGEKSDDVAREFEKAARMNEN